MELDAILRCFADLAGRSAAPARAGPGTGGGRHPGGDARPGCGGGRPGRGDGPELRRAGGAGGPPHLGLVPGPDDTATGRHRDRDGGPGSAGGRPGARDSERRAQDGEQAAPGAPGSTAGGWAARDGSAGVAHLPPEVVDIGRSGPEPAWLGTGLRLPLGPGPGDRRALPRRDVVRRLAAADALRPEGGALRLGWVVVTGRVPIGGDATTVCFPLVSQPVTIERDLARAPNLTLRATGDVELTPLVGDPDRAAGLEEDAQFGGGRLDGTAGPVTAREVARLPRLRGWVREVVAACGLPPVTGLLPPSADLRDRRDRDGLVAWVGAVAYLAPERLPAPGGRPGPEGHRAALAAFAGARGLRSTAFATLYGPAPQAPSFPSPTGPPGPTASPRAPGSPRTPGDDTAVEAAGPLSATQQRAVAQARHAPLTVVTGAPGTGKTTVAAAVAADAAARGTSALLVASSPAAVDRLAEVLADRPGPHPFRFAGSPGPDEVRRLTAPAATAAEVRAAEHALSEARARRALLEGTIVERLGRERGAAAAARWEPLAERLAELAPGAFDGPAPDRLAALLHRAQGRTGVPGTEARGRRRQVGARAAEVRLRALVGAERATPLAELALAVRAAQDRRVAGGLAATGGTVLARFWAELETADDDVAAAAGHLGALRATSDQHRRRAGSGAGRLKPLLAARRHRRRRLLASVDQRALLARLPLWLGTVAEADDLLPPVPGLFDLVVVDDADRLDQLAAAGSLLRARRAVVVGDPRQPRAVARLDESDRHRALKDHGLQDHRARLDVTRAGLLDTATGATPATWLDEHFGSAPAAMAFAAHHLYEGRVTVASRHPTLDAPGAADGLSVAHLAPLPGIGDPAAREVAAALDQVEHLAMAGATGIGLTSPLPDVAERLTAATTERYDLDDIERLGLLVGPLPAFRSLATDHLVVALGLAPGDPPARRRAVDAPEALAMLLTRARHRLVVVTSLPEPAGMAPAGLLDAFLARATGPAGTTPAPAPAGYGGAAGTAPGPGGYGGAGVTGWVAALARELRGHGVAVEVAYPVGRWQVDLVVGKGDDAVAVEAGVHPDGPEAHVERHRELRRTGWRIVDGYPSRWLGDPALAAFEITESVRP